MEGRQMASSQLDCVWTQPTTVTVCRAEELGERLGLPGDAEGGAGEGGEDGSSQPHCPARVCWLVVSIHPHNS